MKPVLYVGLRGVMGRLPWGKISDQHLILVTSEKGSGHRAQVYGRTVDDIPTHASASDIVAKFRDLDAARAVLGKAATAHDAYCVVISRAQEELRTLENTQRNAVKTAIRDLAIP